MSIGVDATNPFISTLNGVSTTAPALRLDSLGHSLSVRDFEDALRLANGSVQPGVQVAQADPVVTVPGTTATDAVSPLVSGTAVPPVAETSPTAEADARLRAAEGLGLASGDDVGPGNSILNGLEQLRAVFDGQYGAVNERLTGTSFDVHAMIALQADIVEYSVLVDVSSKLAGKVTTAIDSLMKGQ